MNEIINAGLYQTCRQMAEKMHTEEDDLREVIGELTNIRHDREQLVFWLFNNCGNLDRHTFRYFLTCIGG